MIQMNQEIKICTASDKVQKQIPFNCLGHITQQQIFYTPHSLILHQ